MFSERISGGFPRARAVCVLAAAAGALVLSGCAKKHNVARTPAAAPRPRSHAPQSPSSEAENAVGAKETGLASWYGHPYHGRAAADGEIYDMETLVAAHRTLRFNTWVRVTNLDNGKTVEVRIIDRGPFVDGRIIDLSHAAAKAIDLIGPGVAEVQLDIIAAPAVPDVLGNFYAVQVGAFVDRARAEQLRASLEQRYGPVRLVLRQGNRPLWRVLVGRESSEDAAHGIAARLENEVGPCFVVLLDDKPAAAPPDPAPVASVSSY